MGINSRTKDEIAGAVGALGVGAVFAGFAFVGFCVVVGSLAYAATMTSLDGARDAVLRRLPGRQAA